MDGTEAIVVPILDSRAGKWRKSLQNIHLTPLNSGSRPALPRNIAHSTRHR